MKTAESWLKTIQTRTRPNLQGSGHENKLNSSTLKNPSKTIHFYFETFRIIINPSSVKKIKQHLAMLSVQN